MSDSRNREPTLCGEKKTPLRPAAGFSVGWAAAPRGGPARRGVSRRQQRPVRARFAVPAVDVGDSKRRLCRFGKSVAKRRWRCAMRSNRCEMRTLRRFKVKSIGGSGFQK